MSVPETVAKVVVVVFAAIQLPLLMVQLYSQTLDEVLVITELDTPPTDIVGELAIDSLKVAVIVTVPV